MRWILLISLTLGTIVSAQSQQAPVFRAGVDLVTMRVVVVDQKGQPVRGLTAEDFSVRLEGQIRPVRVLNYLEVDERTEGPIEARRETTTVGVRPTGPANALPGRTFIFLVDDLSFRHTSSLMQVYRRAIDNLFNRMGPADKVALVTTSGRIAPFGPTTEWPQVRARLEAVRGYFDIEDLRPEVFVSLTEAREIQNVWMWEEAAKMLADGAGLTVWRQAWDRECLLFGNLCEGTVPPPMFFALRSAALNTIAYTEQHTSIQFAWADQCAPVSGTSTQVGRTPDADPVLGGTRHQGLAPVGHPHTAEPDGRRVRRGVLHLHRPSRRRAGG
jgi:hypothetical protein